MLACRRTALAAAAAFAMFAVLAAHAASPTPRRDLAPEAAELALGTAAYVHTDYSAGAGMLLPDGTEVLVARHIVLAPDGSVAQQIGVGLPRLPLNNIVEVATTVEAQDPLLDLVLLRVAVTAELGAPQRGSIKPPCGNPVAAVAASLRSRYVKRRRAVRRAGVRNPNRTGAKQTPVVEARLRIVVDGPRTR
jgi:hypothetical protein